MDKRQKKKSLTGRVWPSLVSFSPTPPPPSLHSTHPTHSENCGTRAAVAVCSPALPRRAPLPFGSHCLPATSQREALSGRPLITMWRGSEEDVPHRQGGEEGTAFPPQGPGATFHQPNILNPSLTRSHNTHALKHVAPSPVTAARVGTPCERAQIITV